LKNDQSSRATLFLGEETYREQKQKAIKSLADRLVKIASSRSLEAGADLPVSKGSNGLARNSYSTRSSTESGEYIFFSLLF